MSGRALASPAQILGERRALFPGVAVRIQSAQHGNMCRADATRRPEGKRQFAGEPLARLWPAVRPHRPADIVEAGVDHASGFQAVPRHGSPDGNLLLGRTAARQCVLHAGQAQLRRVVDVGQRIERAHTGAEQGLLRGAVAEVGCIAELPGHGAIKAFIFHGRQADCSAARCYNRRRELRA
jgi:hypothetical protein